MNLRAIGAGGALALAAALAWFAAPSGSIRDEAGPIILPEPAAQAPPAAVAASPEPTSGLNHAAPPAHETLRDAPARQALYDAEAQPGEFVTPPNVSIER